MHANLRRWAAGCEARLIAAAPTVALGLLLAPIFLGLVGAVWLSLTPENSGGDSVPTPTLSFAAWRALLSYPGLGRSIALTITSGLVSCLLSCLLTFWILAHLRANHPLLRVSLPLFLAFPHVALAMGLAFLVAPSGWLLRLFSPWLSGWTLPPDLPLLPHPWGGTLILGLVLKETPFLLLMALAAAAQIECDKRLAIAQSLGYSRACAWIKVLLPALAPLLRRPIAAVLAYSFSTVDMAIVLAPSQPPPLAVLVLRLFQHPAQLYRAQAAAAALLLFALVLAGLALWIATEQGIARTIGRRFITQGARGRGGAGGAYLAASGFGLIAVTTATCLGLLLLWTGALRWPFPHAWPQSFSWGQWPREWIGLWWRSSALAALTAGLALILVLACLENEQRRGRTITQRALWLLYLPLLVPQIVFLLGAHLLWLRLGLVGSWGTLVSAHALFVLPYIFLTLAAPYRRLDARFFTSARCLGAGPGRVFWRLRIPLLRRPLVFATAVGFAVSIGLYLPTVFASAGRFTTLTTEAVVLFSSDDRRALGRLGLLQALTCLPLFAAALRIKPRAKGAGPWHRYMSSAHKTPPLPKDAAAVSPPSRADRQSLEVRNLSISLETPLFARLSFSIAPGEVITCMGASGCGKSSLLAYICGTLSPNFHAHGEVMIGTRRLNNLRPEQRRVGILYQNDLLFPHLCVAENLAFGLPPGIGRRERQRRVRQALIEIGLQDYGDRHPESLSGGQKIRVALLRCLLSAPQALLLDEPFSALDAPLRARMRSLVFAHIRAAALPALLVTHDPADAQAAAGPLLCLDPGPQAS